MSIFAQSRFSSTFKILCDILHHSSSIFLCYVEIQMQRKLNKYFLSAALQRQEKKKLFRDLNSLETLEMCRAAATAKLSLKKRSRFN